MNPTLPLSDQLRDALLQPTHGVVGVVDDILALCPAGGVRLAWEDETCRVVAAGEPTKVMVDVPLRRSVFRAVLARVATLSSSADSPSVSPYGGTGELSDRRSPPRQLRVTFVNTTERQEVDIAPVRVLGGDFAVPSSRRLVAFVEREELFAPSLARGGRFESTGRGNPPEDTRTPSAWQLGDVRDESDRSIPLPPDVVEACYGDLSDGRVGLSVEFDPVPDDGWVAVGRVIPGPTRGPLAFDLTFPDRSTVRLLFPVVPADPPSASKSVAAPLLTPPPTSDGWELEVEASAAPSPTDVT